MPKNKIKGNIQKDYLNKFREIRQFSEFNFSKDLRIARDDSQFTKSEKAAITRIWNEYEPIRENVRNGSAQVVKPRHHKGESQTQYKKRLKEIRQNTNPDLKYSPFVIANVPKGSSIRFDKNNRMVTKRPRNVFSEYKYPLSAEDKMEFLFDPQMIIEDKMHEHHKMHPNKPALLVGFATNGFPWKMKGIKSYKELAEMFLIKQAEYLAQDDSINIASFITAILIRA